MKHCIISFEDKQIINKLKELGYTCYNSISSNRVSAPICAHTDVLYLKTDTKTIIISSCQKANLPLLEKFGYHVTMEENLKPGYKTESLLNFIINEKYIIHNPKTAMDLKSDKIQIKVKQGYTKCSTICLNEKAYITDDENIYNTLTGNNLDCLKISKGEIRLEGYDYGFIGGASVKLNEKEILFFGDIENITDKTNIINFLGKYGMKRIFMKNKKLVDIGSALIL